MKEAFLVIALLSLASSVGRPEYNLPLFTFLFLSYNKLYGEKKWRQQRFLIALVVGSIVLDLIYVLYWTPLWFSHDWLAWTHWARRLSKITMMVATLILALKTAIVAFMFRPDLMVACGWKAKEDVIEEYDVYRYMPLPTKSM